MVPGNEIPAHHPVRELFLTLTHRGLRESHLSDEEIHLYRPTCWWNLFTWRTCIKSGMSRAAGSVSDGHVGVCGRSRFG